MSRAIHRSVLQGRLAYNRQLRRTYATTPMGKTRSGAFDVGIMGLAGVVLTATAALWWSKRQSAQASSSTSAFTVSAGKSKTLTVNKLTDSQADNVLRANEATFSVARPGNPVYRYDTNFVKSNDPIEDFSSVRVLSGNNSRSLSGDMLFFGIFDGHSGWATSKRLSEQLIDSACKELDLVSKRTPEYLTTALKFPSELPSSTTSPFLSSNTLSSSTLSLQNSFPKVTGTIEEVWNLLRWGKYNPAGDSGDSLRDLEAQPGVIHRALQNAFSKLDHDIVYSPIRLLGELDISKQVKKVSPDGKDKNNQQHQPSILSEASSQQTSISSIDQIDVPTQILPALSGSCALLAYMDVAHNMLHVACAGDSRAVMGVWESSEDGSSGKWKTRVLSDDQQGYNESEIAKIRSEHPPGEKDTVVRRGRVLGRLAPTRSFGDSSYKWTRETFERIVNTFKLPSRNFPSDSKTPPYVTAEPVATTCELTHQPQAQTSEDKEKNQRKHADKRFLVLATDGLWDRLECEEVVGLVGAWLDGVREPKSREEILASVTSSEPGKDASSPATKAPRRNIPRTFTFEDTNVSTHLIRNALGGANRDQVSTLLAIPAPYSRRYRDDITITVVLLGDDEANTKQPLGVRRLLLPRAKSFS